ARIVARAEAQDVSRARDGGYRHHQPGRPWGALRRGWALWAGAIGGMEIGRATIRPQLGAGNGQGATKAGDSLRGPVARGQTLREAGHGDSQPDQGEPGRNDTAIGRS